MYNIGDQVYYTTGDGRIRIGTISSIEDDGDGALLWGAWKFENLGVDNSIGYMRASKVQRYGGARCLMEDGHVQC